MATDRRKVSIPTPIGDWSHPWPNVFELARSMPTDKWTLVGGLMVQAHSLAHGVTVTRPTNDVDVLLHVEIDTAAAEQAHESITGLGYRLREPVDARRKEGKPSLSLRACISARDRAD